jgi:ATP-dependent RNA helicase RhlE
MYKKFNNQNRNRYRVKSINPSLFINNTVSPIVEKKVVIENKFSDFLISDVIKRNIANKGYEIPTPIQDKIIPLILQNRDVIGIANTGTGKTGAFLIPLINKVTYNRSEKVLIIVPTRELAIQIEEELKEFARNLNIFSVLCIGGVGISGQAGALRRNPNFVIGTPGRLKDLKNQGKLNLSLFSNIVLDEVDRMMDMGFINDVKFIISFLAPKRQSMFFSATLPKSIAPLAHSFLRNPVTVSVKTQEVVSKIKQEVIKIGNRNKTEVLCELLDKDEFEKVLVFGRTKWGMEKLYKVLLQKGFRVAAIHGNKNQNQRQRAIKQFKNNEINILIATDIASRGLDIDDVTHVINYDAPASYEDYIHRVGRTARAEKSGSAITFIN